MRFIAVAFLLSIFFVPPQGDLFRKHYDAANAYHRAGNFKAAEAEFKAILGEAYGRLAKIYSAQGNYEASVNAFETERSNEIELRNNGATRPPIASHVLRTLSSVSNLSFL